MYSLDGEVAVARPWDAAKVDWRRVARDIREHRDACETRMVEIVARARADARPLRLDEQERRAALSAGVDDLDLLLSVFDRVAARS